MAIRINGMIIPSHRPHDVSIRAIYGPPSGLLYLIPESRPTFVLEEMRIIYVRSAITWESMKEKKDCSDSWTLSHDRQTLALTICIMRASDDLLVLSLQEINFAAQVFIHNVPATSPSERATLPTAIWRKLLITFD